MYNASKYEKTWLHHQFSFLSLNIPVWLYIFQVIFSTKLVCTCERLQIMIHFMCHKNIITLYTVVNNLFTTIVRRNFCSLKEDLSQPRLISNFSIAVTSTKGYLYCLRYNISNALVLILHTLLSLFQSLPIRIDILLFSCFCCLGDTWPLTFRLFPTRRTWFVSE